MTIPRNQADPGPSGGYRDRILHVQLEAVTDGDLAYLRRIGARCEWQDVQGMQALGDQAVTGDPYACSGCGNRYHCVCGDPPTDRGHGECCCSECETGWAAAWASWVGR